MSGFLAPGPYLQIFNYPINMQHCTQPSNTKNKANLTLETIKLSFIQNEIFFTRKGSQAIYFLPFPVSILGAKIVEMSSDHLVFVDC